MIREAILDVLDHLNPIEKINEWKMTNFYPFLSPYTFRVKCRILSFSFSLYNHLYNKLKNNEVFPLYISQSII